ncbi:MULTISPECIES: hypothetical protein [Paenibacillus]|uniref:hypothetical protein n=1 Tax=Paenibacillus TaxID=44249 RepID=UPI000F52DDB3|nr:MULTISPECIES: hypothetical protein [Paenibacillus]KAA8756040.1 hypothetical protein FE296_05635 [Paenibacillus sp. UASWS1643]RPK28071.1 hypothetical protein EDO6_03594 [Paenibacillus xylanexedens]
MSRFGKRLLSMAVLMLLGVLFGMQLAGGNFQIGNPSGGTSTMVTTEPTSSVTESVPAAPVQKEIKEPPFVPVQSPSQVLGADQSKAPVDVLADKTAGLLQNLSHSGIKWVVSLFSGVAE